MSNRYRTATWAIQTALGGLALLCTITGLSCSNASPGTDGDHTNDNAKAAEPKTSLSPKDHFEELIKTEVPEFHRSMPSSIISKGSVEYDVLATDSVVTPFSAHFTVTGKFFVTRFFPAAVDFLIFDHDGVVTIRFRVDFSFQEGKWVRKTISGTVSSFALRYTGGPAGGIGPVKTEKLIELQDDHVDHRHDFTSSNYDRITSTINKWYGERSQDRALSPGPPNTNKPTKTGTSKKKTTKGNPTTKSNIAEKLKSMDQNKDGFIDRSEATGRQLREKFTALDKNGDGRLSSQEIKKAFGKRKRRKK